MSELKYDVRGWAGRCLKVYDDKVILYSVKDVKGMLNGVSRYGEKVIMYVDCITIQYKKETMMTGGLIQFEVPGAMNDSRVLPHLSENSFSWNTEIKCCKQMPEIAEYIKSRIEHYKQAKNAPVSITNAVSPAEELKKFKELLDLGIITQEEFDAKKKQLLGL